MEMRVLVAPSWLKACQVAPAALEALIYKGSSVFTQSATIAKRPPECQDLAQLRWHLALWDETNFRIVCHHLVDYAWPMQKNAVSTKGVKSDDQLLDQAILQLLGAVKQHSKAEGKPLKRDQLLKDGYSERFIAKVEEA